MADSQVSLLATRPCRRCHVELAAGDPIVWDREEGGPVCLTCHATPRVYSTAELADRRRTEGEKTLFRILDALAKQGYVVLRDRIDPVSKLVIPNLVVTTRGVVVVDVRTDRGRVVLGDVRRWGGTDTRLFVAGEDKTQVLSVTRRMASLASEALRGAGDIPVFPTLCFTDSDVHAYARTFIIDRVRVGWPRAMHQIVAKEGHLTADDIDRAARALAAGLPQA